MDTIDSHFREPSIDELDTEKLLAHAAQQAQERGYDKFLIVDCDSHHYETESFAEIVEFIPDPVLQKLAKRKVSGGAVAPGLFVTQLGFQDMGGRITRYSTRGTEKTPPKPHREITLAHRWMDAIGIDIACIFPTSMLSLGLHPQKEIEVAMARAYNGWLCEKVLAADPRLRSMLYLPFNDPRASVKIVEEFGRRKGVIGFMVSAGRYLSVHDDEYMKTYAMLEERGLPLAFHASYNWFNPAFLQANRFITLHALGFTFHNMLHLTNWIMNGLPKRFPKLKTVWIESGLAWVPFLMQRLDNEYKMRSSEAALLKRLPSEYIRDMYFTSQPMESADNHEVLEMTFKMINAETQLLYASDYPHWDFDLPSTIYDLPFLSQQAKVNILGGNAVKLYGLDGALSERKRARA